jgi:tRNA pseudouridine55 synthase
MLSSAAVDGILLVDKDPGKTSHDIVAEVRHALDERHAGHTGTLDPAATGLLVVALGRALKMVPYHEGHDKEYAVTVRLGVRTETDDAAGRVLEQRDASAISREAVEAALPRFTGPIRQRPPAYSAVKVDGERAYRLARRGEAVELPERDVTIHELRIESFEPPLAKLVLRGSKGTYVRSIARDLGDALGCGGSVSELRRLAVGPFRVERAVRLDLAGEADLRKAILPADAGLDHLPAVHLDAGEAHRFIQGKLLDQGSPAPWVRIYEGTTFLGIGEEKDQRLKARRVY